jgi:hypothetical protein
MVIPADQVKQIDDEIPDAWLIFDSLSANKQPQFGQARESEEYSRCLIIDSLSSRNSSSVNREKESDEYSRRSIVDFLLSSDQIGQARQNQSIPSPSDHRSGKRRNQMDNAFHSHRQSRKRELATTQQQDRNNVILLPFSEAEDRLQKHRAKQEAEDCTAATKSSITHLQEAQRSTKEEAMLDHQLQNMH